MSSRWTVATAAAGAAALALAGCAQGATAGRAGSSAPKAAGAAASGGDAAAVRASYATTVATGSVAVHLVEKVSGGPTGSLSVTADGVVDLAHARSRFLVHTGRLGTSEVRVVGGKAYAKLPAAVAGMLHGKVWVALAVPAGATGGAGAALGGGVTDQLSVLRDVSSSVRRVGAPGAAEVGGVAATEYLAQVDRAKVLSRDGLKAAGSAAGAASLPATIPVHVWIDAQGRTRRLTLTVSARPSGSAAAVTVAVTETLSGFGRPVSVTAPPASQTTDLGDLSRLGGALSSLGGSNGGGSFGDTSIGGGSSSS